MLVDDEGRQLMEGRVRFKDEASTRLVQSNQFVLKPGDDCVELIQILWQGHRPGETFFFAHVTYRNMDALIVASGLILLRQYRRSYSLGVSPEMEYHRFDTSKDFEADARIQDGNQPTTKPIPYDYGNAIDRQMINEFRLQPPTSFMSTVGAPYRPSWMRASEAQAPKQESVRDLEREYAHDQGSRQNIQDALRQSFALHAPQSLNEFGQGGLPEEQIRVPPPAPGGYAGYDAVRGRDPIARFNRYDLGEDLTTQGMSDDGLSRGFAFGEAGRSENMRQESWSIMPSRQIQGQPMGSSGGARGFGGGCSLQNAFGGSSLEGDTKEGIRLDGHGNAGRIAHVPLGAVYGEGPEDKTEYVVNPVGVMGGTTANASRGSSRDVSVTPQSARHVPESFLQSKMMKGAGNVAPVSRTLLAPSPKDVMSRVHVGANVPTSKYKGASMTDPLKSTPNPLGKGWKFSFDLRKLLDVDTAKGIRPTSSVYQEVDRRGYSDGGISTNPQTQHLPLNIQEMPQNTAPEMPVRIADTESRQEIFRHALPPLGTIAESVGNVDKRVVTQKAETDTWTDYDLSQSQSQATKYVARSKGVSRKEILMNAKQRTSFETDKRLVPSIPAFAPKGSKGVTDLKTTSTQSVVTGGFKVGTTLNSALKQQTADAPAWKVSANTTDRAHRESTHLGQESSSGIHVSKRQATSTQPFATAKGSSSRNPIGKPLMDEHEDTAIGYDNDVIADRAGKLASPMRAPKGTVPDYAMLPVDNTMREGKEFRRRS